LNTWKWAAIALAAPGCVLAAFSVIVPAMAGVGHDPVWPHEPYNLAEAAAVRDEAEVVRLIEQGHDPNMRYDVRARWVFDHPTRLTPLEAAVVRDDPEIVRQLLAKGAVMNEGLWARLRCAAASPSLRAVLDQYRPASAPQDCDDLDVTVLFHDAGRGDVGHRD